MIIVLVFKLALTEAVFIIILYKCVGENFYCASTFNVKTFVIMMPY